MSVPTPLSTVVRALPVSGTYRIRAIGRYLFAFDGLDADGSDGRDAHTVVVRLPAGSFRNGDEIVIANLCAPVYEVSLEVHVTARSGAQQQLLGFPLVLRGFQQQTFWWIRGSGWVYAGGAGHLSALPSTPSAPSATVLFNPSVTDTASLGIQLNVDMTCPLFYASVVSITGEDDVSGSVNFSDYVGIFSTCGVDDGLYGPWNIAMTSSTGQLTLLSDGTTIEGTVTVVLQVYTGWQDGPATSTSPPPTGKTTITFSNCTMSAVSIANGYVTNLTIQLSAGPYASFVGDDLQQYKWFWSNYTGGPRASKTSVLTLELTNPEDSTVTNFPYGQVPIGIQVVVSGQTYTASIYYSGSDYGNTSYAYNGLPPQDIFVSGNEGWPAHGVAGVSSEGFYLMGGGPGSGSPSFFIGYATLSEPIPIPYLPNGSTSDSLPTTGAGNIVFAFGHIGDTPNYTVGDGHAYPILAQQWDQYGNLTFIFQVS